MTKSSRSASPGNHQSTSPPPPLIDRLTMLSDMARVRLLRLLDREALTVGELSRIMQLPQSTVSRHLKVLYEGGWLVKRPLGTASVYSMNHETLDEQAAELWTLTQRHLGPIPGLAQDDSRLTQVLAERSVDSTAFFGRLGGEWDDLRGDLFGEAFTDEALLHLIDPAWTIADLGCGTANAAEHLAPLVNQVIAVDREAAMLDAARKRLADCDNVDFRQGDLTDLPIEDGSINAALVFLVLHHLLHPQLAITEIARVLAPAGIALVVDMVAHDRESYRHTMGHQHLGFDEPTLRNWAKESTLTPPRYQLLRPNTSAAGPGLFVATMRKRR